MENLHFLRAGSQILALVDTARSVAAQQKGVAFNAGDDLWVDLIQAGQISPDTSRTNNWGGAVKAYVTPSLTMRVESDLPTHDCRRMAAYFLARQPAALGLLGMEAQAAADKDWVTIFPLPPNVAVDPTQTACGKDQQARIALVFRIK